MSTELLTIYNNLQSKLQSAKQEAQEAAKTLLTEATAEYFAKYAEYVQEVYWTQGAPSFNDGEACYFYVDDPVISLYLLDGEDYGEYESSGYYEQLQEDLENQLAKLDAYTADPLAWSKAEVARHNSMTSWDKLSDDYYVRFPPVYEDRETLQQSLDLIKNLPSSFDKDSNSLVAYINAIDDDIKQALFGDSSKISFTRDGVQVEDWYRDY